MTKGAKLGRWLLHEANKQKRCLNCKFSWLHETTGYGHCGYGDTIYPKDIEEWDTCKHWEPKLIPKKDDYEI